MCVTDALTGQKKEPQIPVNWSYRWLRVWELNLSSLRTKPQFSAKAAGTLVHRAIRPAPDMYHCV